MKKKIDFELQSLEISFEIKHYTVKNYLKRICVCNIIENHSLAASQTKNDHI